MTDAHIINILESNRFDNLSASDLAMVRAHAAHCDGCRRAYTAAQISALLLKERAAAEFEPSPFFQTRVLAALRERQATIESPVASFRRLWKTAGGLVSGMAATVATLAVFTFVAPSPSTAPQDAASDFDNYSAEEVILARDESPADLSYEQVLTTIYESGENAQ